MKTFKKISIATAALAVFAGTLLFVACGGGAGDADAPGEPGEVEARAVSAPRGIRAVYENNIRMMEDFSRAMDKAANADQVTAALNGYTRQMEKLAPQMKALKEKYPQLADMERTGEFPDEVKDLEEKFTELGMKMMKAMVKVMEYEDNPKVRAAQEKMLEAAEQLMK